LNEAENYPEGVAAIRGIKPQLAIWLSIGNDLKIFRLPTSLICKAQ